MAEQDGILQLKGNVGKFSFFKQGNAYMARTKTGVSKNKILTDPAYARTRENMAEFSRAAKASRLLRACFTALLVSCKDGSRTRRLTRDFMAVVKADITNDRGFRNVLDGETELLKGFEMNANGSLQSTLKAPFTAAINRVAGELVVNVPAFVPLNMVIAPEGATHFKIKSAGAAVDFETGTYEVVNQTTAELPWNIDETAPITLTNALTPNSTKPLFLVLGIEFFISSNGRMYPLKNGIYNAAAIVEVSGV